MGAVVHFCFANGAIMSWSGQESSANIECISQFAVSQAACICLLLAQLLSPHLTPSLCLSQVGFVYFPEMTARPSVLRNRANQTHLLFFAGVLPAG